MTKKKTSTALVKVKPKKPEPAPQQTGLGLRLPDGRRLPGVAVQTNPLIAVIACMTEEHVEDLGKEIEATRNYLAGMEAIHGVVSRAFPKTVEVVEPPPAPPPAPEPIATLNGKPLYTEPPHAPLKTRPMEPTLPDPEPEPKNPPGRPVTPATKQAGTWNGGRKVDPNSATSIIKEMLKKDFSTKADVILAEVKARSNTKGTDQSIKAQISKIRSDMKSVANLAKMQANDDKVNHNAMTNKEVEAAAGAEDEDGDEELELRKEVAEFLFKRGLATNAEIMRQCGIPSSRIMEFMKHPWFEYVAASQQWRLTVLGKQEGLEY